MRLEGPGGLPSTSIAGTRMLSALQSDWCTDGAHLPNTGSAVQRDQLAPGSRDAVDSRTGR